MWQGCLMGGASLGGALVDRRVVEWCGHRFVWTARIEPERDDKGEPLEFMPQGRYSKAGSARLHAHGAGPFCRIRLRSLPARPCVYAVTVEDVLTYVGMAENLAARWGLGQYGSIQPRNCYVGGQSTNCKINNLLLLEARKRSRIELWCQETAQRMEIEAELIRRLDPPWNGSTARILSEGGASE